MKKLEIGKLEIELMAEASPNPLIVVDDLGKIRYANNFATSLFLYTHNELIGEKAEKLIPSKFSNDHLTLIKSYLKKPVKRELGVDEELRAVKKDGTEFPVSVGLNPVMTKEGLLILAGVIDISVRKKLEETYQQSEFFFGNTRTLTCIANLQGYFEVVNPQFEHVLGYSKAELLENKFFAYIHPNDIAATLFELEQLEKGAKSINFSNRIRKKDGSYLWFEWNSTPDPTTGKIYAIARDVTARKKLEKSVRDKSRKLQKQNEELKLSQERLRESNSAKDKFFSIISHDLMNPFNIIMSYTHALNADYNSYSEEEKKEIIKDIDSTTKSTFEMLKNLLSWARSQLQKIEIKKVELHLVHWVDEIIKPYAPNLKNKNIKVQVDIPEDQVVFADKYTMGVAIGNLVNNAIKFTHSGGTIVISHKILKRRINLLVKDTGIGMTKEKLSDLFGIENSASTRGTNNEKGTGLGLILCKEFVEKNGGSIIAKSEIGEGSEFIISLPRT